MKSLAIGTALALTLGVVARGSEEPSTFGEKPATPQQRQILQLNLKEQEEVVALGRELLEEMQDQDVEVYRWVMEDAIQAMEESRQLLSENRSDAETIESQEEALRRISEMLDGLKQLMGHLMEHPERNTSKPQDQELPPRDQRIEEPLVKLRDELALLRIKQIDTAAQAGSARRRLAGPSTARSEDLDKRLTRAGDQQKRIGELSAKGFEKIFGDMLEQKSEDEESEE